MHRLTMLYLCRASTTAGVFVVIGGVLVYLRFVKGYKLTDLMYVTKSSLNNLKQSMSEGKPCWPFCHINGVAPMHAGYHHQRQHHLG